MAPPSASTKPSRSLSNGRLAVSGESFLVERALMLENAATVSPVMDASAPPVTIASARPWRMRLNDSPMACADEAQAETVAKLGPLRP